MDLFLWSRLSHLWDLSIRCSTRTINKTFRTDTEGCGLPQPLDKTGTSTAVVCGTWRADRNGEGVSRFHSLTHLSAPIRTFFPKSSGFPTPFAILWMRQVTNAYLMSPHAKGFVLACSAREAEAIALVLRSAGAGCFAAAASA